MLAKKTSITQQAREPQSWASNPGPPDFKVHIPSPLSHPLADTKGHYGSASTITPHQTSWVNKSRAAPLLLKAPGASLIKGQSQDGGALSLRGGRGALGLQDSVPPTTPAALAHGGTLMAWPCCQHRSHRPVPTFCCECASCWEQALPCVPCCPTCPSSPSLLP